jgi:toxin ParE1/3/4
MPGIGRQREDLAPRLRGFPFGNYVIFYRPMENGVEIVRVLHGARDLPPLFD